VAAPLLYRAQVVPGSRTGQSRRVPLLSGDAAPQREWSPLFPLRCRSRSIFIREYWSRACRARGGTKPAALRRARDGVAGRVVGAGLLDAALQYQPYHAHLHLSDSFGARVSCADGAGQQRHLQCLPYFLRSTTTQ
jgi:hypothetical protein